MTDQGSISSSNLRFSWQRVPWDSDLFGGAVFDVPTLELRTETGKAEFAVAFAELTSGGMIMASCRLDHFRIAESIMLEDNGFRFIEMTIQPQLSNLHLRSREAPVEVEVASPTPDDIPQILAIARAAFRNERHYFDPRIDANLSDQRFAGWAKNSLNHPTQFMRVVRKDERLVAFFVNELLDDGTCYWHLNAVSPEMQGKGIGKQAWMAMILDAQRLGAHSVQSNVAVRNHRALNLYASFGFRYKPPRMTFHWVRA